MDERRVYAVTAVTAGTATASAEGSTYSLVGASYQDNAASPFNAPHSITVDWGDGSQSRTSNGTLAASEPTAANTPTSIVGLHTYVNNGTYNVRITVVGADASSVTSSALAVVVSNVAPTPNANGPYTTGAGGTVVLSGTATDPGVNDTLTYTWDLDGDNVFGETGAGATRGNETGQTPTFNGSAMARGTSQTISLRVNDGTASTTVQTTVTRNNLPTISTISNIVTPKGVAPGTISFTVGDTETAAGSLTLSASSSNTGVVTNAPASFTFGGAGANRTLTIAPVASAVGTTTITLTVTDGNGESSQTTFQVRFNAPPSLTPTAAALSYTENEGEKTLDGGINVADADSGNLTGATVAITLLDGDDEQLLFDDLPAITGTYAGGILELEGVATVAQYQAALRSIRYVNTSEKPAAGNRTITFQVTDGIDIGNVATRALNITAVNDAPKLTGANDLTAIDEDVTNAANAGTLVSALIAGHMTDDDGAGALRGIAVTGVVNTSGTWQYSTDGGANWLAFGSSSTTSARLLATDDLVRFVPNANFNGTVTNGLTFRAWDQTSGTAGGTANTAINGATSAFSTATASASITVNPVNDRPTVATSGGTTVYTENGAAVVVDSGVTVADIDDTHLAGATITITNYAGTQDELLFTDQNGIMGEYEDGELKLTGNATKAQYQTALRSITYRNTSDAPNTTTRTVSFVVNDGDDDSLAATRSVSVTAVNDLPELPSVGTNLVYSKNDPATPIDPNITIDDPDSPTMTGAVISLTNRKTNDFLVFTNQNGITGTVTTNNATTYTITLSGTATREQYETALQSVSFFNSGGTPNTTNRIVTFRVNDGVGNSAVVSRTIEVQANRNPVVTVGGTLAYTENAGAVILASALTVSDADDTHLQSATITITNYAGTQDQLLFTNQNGITGEYDAGQLKLTGNATKAQYQAALRSITYRNTSDAPDTTTRSVTFKINDGDDDSATATRLITIAAVNDAPKLTGANDLTAIDEDVTNAANTGTLVSALIAGHMTDDDGAGALRGIAVTGVVNTNGTWQYSTDGGANWLAFGSPSATSARLLASDDLVRFVPNANFNGPVNDGLAFRAWDQTSGTAGGTANTTTNGATTAFSMATASASVTVNPVNDAPTVTTTGGTTSYTENGAAVVVDSGLTVADIDDTHLAGATITITNYAGLQDELLFTDQNGITGEYDAGELKLTGNATKAQYQAALRSITYRNTSDAPNTTTRTVSFVVNDGDVDSLAATRSVSVAAVNDAPTITGAPTNIVIRQNVASDPILVTVNDLDDAAGTLILSGTSSNQAIIPDAGIIFGGIDGARTIVLTPVAAASGDVQITITVRDPAGALATTTINVAVNNPPEFTTLPAGSQVDEDTPLVDTVVAVTDAETPPADLLVTATSDNQALVPNAGIVIISDGAGGRTIRAAIVGNAFGDATITVRVRDAGGLVTTAQYLIRVNPVNDRPVVAAGQSSSGREDTVQTGTLMADDADQQFVQALRFRVVDGPLQGTLQLDAGGTFRYTPNANFAGPDSFTFVVTDDDTAGGPELESLVATFTITVEPVADAPAFPVVNTAVGLENVAFPLQLPIALTDTDGSERLTKVRIEGVSPHVNLLRSNGTPLIPTAIGTNGLRTYEMMWEEFQQLSIFALDNIETSLRIVATSTEVGTAENYAFRNAESSTTLPVRILNVPPQIASLRASDVDAEASTSLTAVIRDAPNDFYTLIIQWGVSKTGFPQETVLGNVNPSAEAIFGSFQFLVAPDPANPSAPITILITAIDKDGGVATDSVTINVPGTGIPTPIVRTIGGGDVRTPLRAFDLPERVEVRTTIPPITAAVTGRRSLVQAINGPKRFIELRTVDTRDQDADEGYQLPLTILDDLPTFLRKLPDGHYRLYLQEGEFMAPRMLADVVVFRGRAVAPGDLHADRPPKQTAAKDVATSRPVASAARTVEASERPNSASDKIMVPPAGTAPPGGQ